VICTLLKNEARLWLSTWACNLGVLR
jgi:MFS family permease